MFENKKRVYRFGGKTAEGDGTMRELLGGKGANLAEMSKLGMPVPAGFTITTECCAEYYELGGGYTEALKKEVAAALEATEKLMGKKKFEELLGAYVVKPKGKLTLVKVKERKEIL